jgi:hypothetical protein
MVNEFGDHLLLTDYDPGKPFKAAPAGAHGPPLPASTGLEMTEARDCLQQALESAGGSLVSYELIEISGQPAVEAIMKYWRLPPGQTETWSFVEPWYVGRLRVKTPDGNWVLVEIQCEDRNPHMTGVREVAAYLGGHDVGLDHDDERWDADFTNEPLSRLRQHLRRCREALQLLGGQASWRGAT